MKYFDETRPRLGNGMECYVDKEGRAVSAIPALDVRPGEDGRWRVHVMLRVGGSRQSYRWFHTSLDDEGMFGLLRDWKEGVEEALEKYFGYQWEPFAEDLGVAEPPPFDSKDYGGKKAGKKEMLTLDDLLGDGNG